MHLFYFLTVEQKKNEVPFSDVGSVENEPMHLVVTTIGDKSGEQKKQPKMGLLASMKT